MRAGVLYEEEKGGELAGLINAREGGEAKEEGYSRKEWVAEPNAQTISDFSGKCYTQTKWDRREYSLTNHHLLQLPILPESYNQPTLFIAAM